MNEELKNILLKVSELYTKYGIKSITMDDVAVELGISKKTLYQYVTDKDDLVGKFIDSEIILRQEEICKCFKTDFNAIEELFEISPESCLLDRVDLYPLEEFWNEWHCRAVASRDRRGAVGRTREGMCWTC